jgi:ribosome-binding protein aMBF1 (putative translation factor)
MDATSRLADESHRRKPDSGAPQTELTEIRDVGDFVDAVLTRLAAKGMSRKELAHRADLNAASLRRLLTDPSANPTLTSMRKITEVLELRITLNRHEDA